ncbi:solute carrier family 41 member 1 isoform X2 [Tachypleus tridentatus]|uniref:solute carrier family 41 member 1 isoform X2 n=1 Tax=Tachypleus tridentatus TaxID=6853 RepID=UPI003FD5B090
MNEVTSVPSFDGHNRELRHRKLVSSIHMEQNELFSSPPDIEAQKSKESSDLTFEAQDKYSKLVRKGDDLSLELFDLAQYEGEKDNEPLLQKEYSVQEVPTYKPSMHVHAEEHESLWAISVQVFIPFLIAGLGTVGAGLVLDAVQHWKVFVVVSEVFILVPALLGLKGNLEMTLASRLSTQANLGHLDSFSQQWKITYGNMALLQCQASVVGFLASLFAMIMGWIPEGKFDIHHGLLLCASSLLTASIASLALGTNVWVAPSVIAFALLLLPLWGFIAYNNEFTHDVLYSGWTPVISAMAISSIGGCILDFAVTRFHGIAVFQPVINGVGGNLVAVQASRISTFLHQRSKLGTLPPSDSHLCINPCSAFCSSNPHARTARILMLMVIPGHLIFTYGIHFVQAGHTSITVIFLVTYLTAAVIQVLILLYIAFCMIHWMWKKRIDPDNSAIPYLTALGDFLGTALLSLSFLFLYSVGDKDADVGE